jgi:Lrp/AsnC family transcriptional regulator, regulator for asnA, asnC and gidA
MTDTHATPAPARADHVVNSSRIDDVDKEIISLLQVDGRLSYSAIGRHARISEASVRSRVQNLRKQGIIQIVAVTDPLQLGFSHEAMVSVRAASDPEQVADRLSEIEEIDFLVLVAGSFDILLEVVADDDDGFLALIQRIRDVAAPGTVRVHPYLKTWKQEYSWGVR